MTPERAQKMQRMLQRRQQNLTVLLEDVYKPHNLSAILRTCDAVGIETVHAICPTGGVPTYNDTSGGSHKWVQLVVHTCLHDALEDVHKQHMRIYAAHFSQQAIHYRQADYTRPTCILLGNEKNGVSPAAAQQIDKHIVIPMMGMVPSLNVSVAAAVILFEAQHQRQAIGLYGLASATKK
ncbi:MAG: tRNA (guanosine(18)-2'-O)-methyltransferase TrmH [Myxococcota bacterium]